MNKKYVYKPYNELFSKLFLEEKRRLLNILKEECFDVEHIGSTAIPGLGGKGIIDIGITVAKENFDSSFHKIESLGYIFRETGSSPERWFFRIDLPDPQEGTRRYHVHLTFPESIEWKKLIAFRDYLRLHPSVLEEYAELKRKSAEEVNENGALYRKKKSPFFEKVLAKALKHKIYFVIGASGSGKTTTLKLFEKSIPENCTLLHFDSIGVPPFEEMEKEYGSIEEWQRIKTADWVKKIAEEQLSSSNIIFDAQIRPSFIKEACDLYGVGYDIILFDCSDTERKKRLIARGDAELADENMMNWSAFLRKECQKHHHKIISNSHITIEQTLQLFVAWLQNQLYTQLEIPVHVVTELIGTQFPEYINLPIKAVEPNGWDNRTFRLGKELSIRLPSAERYAAKVPIEHKWLPKLASELSIPIPTPIAIGKPNKNYPWNWSIYGWIEGQSANVMSLDDKTLEKLAVQLADFLNELQAIDSSDGPPSGKHNFFRGASPIVYDAETRSAIDTLEDYIDAVKATSVWKLAISSKWNAKPVWIHGDFSAGNILVKNNQLAGVIDFGGMAVGDPSCDLAIAWTLFNGLSRDKFRSTLQLDEDTWNRAKGWVLWKALITLEAIEDKTSSKAYEQLLIIKDVLKDS
jgi:aminoglycoside phosphotransferase (APT) family kinase protein/GrpB-like predicted nucleotidyltransferase (UPF0157 family)/dephospho-CoA kinase